MNGNGNGFRFDWRLSVVLVVINLIAIGIQWGTLSAKIEELFRAKEQQERHLEFIDNELKSNGVEAGELKEFRYEMEKRLDKVDDQLLVLGRKRQ